MDLGLRDKVVVISGGGSGIGEAISRAAVCEGAKVAVVTRMDSAARDFKTWVEQQRADCLIIPAELAVVDQCRGSIQQVQQHFGRIDALVNNAGLNDSVGLETGSPEKFAASLQANLIHCYALTHFALPSLKLTSGSIVNISSKVALTGQGGTSAYAAAKGAQLALTREWAVELLPYRIRVNAVIPAEVMTPQYKTWIGTQSDPEEAIRRVAERIPLEQRFTTTQEIAAAVLFLLSPLQSAHTTGQHLVVDGGYIHLDRVLTQRQEP